ncbi:MAG: TatD family hydrolase [Alphaproteobacteria bacterium]
MNLGHKCRHARRFALPTFNYPQLSDTKAVIARAREAGVALMQTISTQRSDFAQVKALAEAHPEIYCSIGIHPHEAAPHEDISEEELLREAAHPRVIGIGETGLDYYYEHSPREVQRALFRRHIRVARALDCRSSSIAATPTRRRSISCAKAMEEGAFRFLIHCFSSTKYLSEESVKFGGYISCSGILTFKKSQPLRDAVADVPLESLLVETDSPYLAPEPFRGKPCEPAYTKLTAERLAEVKGVSFEEIAQATTANFFRLFTKARLPA